MPLTEPFDLLDLQDGASVLFRVERWEQGTMLIKTTAEPTGKVIPVLRVFVPRADKPMGAPYWDVTSKTLQVELLGLFGAPNLGRRVFRVTARGVAPKKRFQVEVQP